MVVQHTVGVVNHNRSVVMVGTTMMHMAQMKRNMFATREAHDNQNGHKDGLQGFLVHICW